MFKTRLISTIVISLFIIWLVLFAPTVVTAVSFLVFSIIGYYEFEKGKDGIDAFGLNSSSVGANSDVPEDNYYAVTLYPEQIISGGVDKSDTNIPEGMELKYVWVVINHGDEGIEGQLLDLNGATYDTYEYVKAAD